MDIVGVEASTQTKGSWVLYREKELPVIFSWSRIVLTLYDAHRTDWRSIAIDARDCESEVTITSSSHKGDTRRCQIRRRTCQCMPIIHDYADRKVALMSPLLAHKLGLLHSDANLSYGYK